MPIRVRWCSHLHPFESVSRPSSSAIASSTRAIANSSQHGRASRASSSFAVPLPSTRSKAASASSIISAASTAPRGSFTPTSTTFSRPTPPPKAKRQPPRTTTKMTAIKIDGTATAKAIRERLRSEIEETQKINPSYKPCLKIIQVGERSDSTTYVRMKLKAAREANIDCELLQFPQQVTETELLETLIRLNNDPTVHGILVQLPLPHAINEDNITSTVADEKDVDGFGTNNIGHLAKRGGKPLFIPCTPKGVMVLLEETGIDLKGKHAVVLGRSNIVGSPVSYLLKDAHATVTVCHSHTVGIENIVKLADVLVVAIGSPNYVKGEWIKPGAVVIDVGTNSVADETKKSGWRLIGDVDYESAVEVASYITPVPGGVGPMTVAMLLQNVVDSANSHYEKQKA